jgi:hypothetical protein
MPINRSIFVDSWAGRIAGGKLHGASGHGQERQDWHGAEVRERAFKKMVLLGQFVIRLQT